MDGQEKLADYAVDYKLLILAVILIIIIKFDISGKYQINGII